jgi:hypothetical protein
VDVDSLPMKVKKAKELNYKCSFLDPNGTRVKPEKLLKSD